MTMTREITIYNNPSELQRVACFVEAIGNELGLDGELLMNLNLALEEMVSTATGSEGRLPALHRRGQWYRHPRDGNRPYL